MRAVITYATADREGTDNVITSLEVLYTWAYFVNNAGKLMTHYEIRRRLLVTSKNVKFTNRTVLAIYFSITLVPLICLLYDLICLPATYCRVSNLDYDILGVLNSWDWSIFNCNVFNPFEYNCTHSYQRLNLWSGWGHEELRDAIFNKQRKPQKYNSV